LEQYAKQLVLPISWAFPRDASGFVVSSCNEYAVKFLEKWPFVIRENFVCLVGENGSGKTHLSMMWATRLNADIFSLRRGNIINGWLDLSGSSSQKFYVLDDADELDDDMLMFYIYNTIKAKNAFLLMTAKTYPTIWPVKLRDVKSRMSTVNVVRIQKPDEMAVPLIIEKMLYQRGLSICDGVAQYISTRIDRSYESISYWIGVIDSKLIGKKMKVSLALIRSILR
jgi:chromosomal replication initiation ATPase DnaA